MDKVTSSAELKTSQRLENAFLQLLQVNLNSCLQNRLYLEKQAN